MCELKCSKGLTASRLPDPSDHARLVYLCVYFCLAQPLQVDSIVALLQKSRVVDWIPDPKNYMKASMMRLIGEDGELTVVRNIYLPLEVLNRLGLII
jgi:hypothetical protein